MRSLALAILAASVMLTDEERRSSFDGPLYLGPPGLPRPGPLPRHVPATPKPPTPRELAAEAKRARKAAKRRGEG